MSFLDGWLQIHGHNYKTEQIEKCLRNSLLGDFSVAGDEFEIGIVKSRKFKVQSG